MALVHYNVIWPADRLSRIPPCMGPRNESQPGLIPKDTYELDVGTPPTLCLLVKDEDEQDEEEWKPRKMPRLKMDENSTDNLDIERPKLLAILRSVLPSSNSTSNTTLLFISTSKPASTVGKCAYTWHTPSFFSHL